MPRPCKPVVGVFPMVPVATKKGPTPFGRKLRELRDAAELSQAALGAKVGMTRDVIARLETSLAANPTLDTIRKLAEALGCEPADLIADTPAPKRKRGV